MSILPTRKELTKPEDMSEKHWSMLFNAHMSRYDAFSNGIALGYFLAIIFCWLLTLLKG